jgi:hypothetical protein
MEAYREIRQIMLRDYRWELDRELRNSHLKLIHRPTGALAAEPVILRLYWQLTDAGSRPRVRAGWVR